MGKQYPVRHYFHNLVQTAKVGKIWAYLDTHKALLFAHLDERVGLILNLDFPRSLFDGLAFIGQDAASYFTRVPATEWTRESDKTAPIREKIPDCRYDTPPYRSTLQVVDDQS